MVAAQDHCLSHVPALPGILNTLVQDMERGSCLPSGDTDGATPVPD